MTLPSFGCDPIGPDCASLCGEHVECAQGYAPGFDIGACQAGCEERAGRDEAYREWIRCIDERTEEEQCAIGGETCGAEPEEQS